VSGESVNHVGLLLLESSSTVFQIGLPIILSQAINNLVLSVI